MTERLLQFIWQFQYFNVRELQTTAGEDICIIHPGTFNAHQGPDFLEAKLRIADALWVGHVELHLASSCWNKHAHHLDPNYDNVILHVVWTDDRETAARGIPKLVLQDRIHKLLLQQYGIWMNSRSFIPCAQYVHFADDIIWLSWKERLLVERIRRKCLQVEELLNQHYFHWEKTFWLMLSKNFGLSVNAEAFGDMAASIPLSLLWKHKNEVNQLEALLLGQAGLLEGTFTDSYPQMLQKEYAFWRTKYSLEKISVPIHFLRMRPASFPTVRLAQLAMLIHQSPPLFAAVRDASDIRELRELLRVEASHYWHYRFGFDEPSAFQPKRLGMQMVNNIIINTIIPMVFAYGHLHKEEGYQRKALEWIRELPAEKNAVSIQFNKLRISSASAGDTQSLKELKTQYCDQRRCLDCAIGAAILKRTIWKLS